MFFWKDVSVFNYSKADEIAGKESIDCLTELLDYENTAAFPSFYNSHVIRVVKLQQSTSDKIELSLLLVKGAYKLRVH